VMMRRVSRQKESSDERMDVMMRRVSRQKESSDERMDVMMRRVSRQKESSDERMDVMMRRVSRQKESSDERMGVMVLVRRPPAVTTRGYSDAKKLRIVMVGFRVGDRSRGRYATPADFPRHDMVPCTGGYAYAVGVWDLSIVQGPLSVAPCPNPNVLRFATFSFAVGRRRAPRTLTDAAWLGHAPPAAPPARDSAAPVMGPPPPRAALVKEEARPLWRPPRVSMLGTPLPELPPDHHAHGRAGQ
jgi:hypothetical protein